MKTLKQAREDKGVMKTAMAKHLGITAKTYATYEKHPERMRLDTAMRAAEFLGMSMNDIFFFSNEN